jgi:hypothetical protein
MATLFGLREVWCTDVKPHDDHSRYNQRTGETTMCPGTTEDEARAWEYERTWSINNDK